MSYWSWYWIEPWELSNHELCFPVIEGHFEIDQEILHHYQYQSKNPLICSGLRMLSQVSHRVCHAIKKNNYLMFNKYRSIRDDYFALLYSHSINLTMSQKRNAFFSKGREIV